MLSIGGEGAACRENEIYDYIKYGDNTVMDLALALLFQALDLKYI